MTEQFTVDRAHSSLGFSTKHMMVTTVRGRFDDFAGTIELPEGDPARAIAEFTVQVASIDTGNGQRDEHLRSADFFDAGRHPEMTYRSTRITEQGEGRYRAEGDLTIRGVTHPLTLDVEVGERFQDPWGKQRVGLNATGRLNRKDWGLNWNQVLEAGRLLVGEEVKLEIDAAFVLAEAGAEVAA
jgi:polyisoprenoid-binding protein YceI